MPLLLPQSMPTIDGVEIPKFFYWVIDDPAPLAGMTFPRWSPPWEEMRAAGFRHVVCLTDNAPGYDPAPLGVLHSVELQDLYGGLRPDRPDHEEILVKEVVLATANRIANGEGVAVHCLGGTGRTGAVIGCVLRVIGFASKEVIEYLDELHRARGRPGWPESAWQAEVVERFQPG